MKRIIIITFTALLLTAIILGGCAEPASAPAPTTAPPTAAPAKEPIKPIKIKAGHDQPTQSPMAQNLENWGKEVTKRTEGRLTFEFYPNATLFPTPSALDAVTSGIADIILIAITNFGQRFPLSNIAALPGDGFPDTAKGMLAAEAAFSDLINKFPAVANEFKDFKYLWEYHGEAYYLFIKNKEAHIPQDVKGMKIGSSGLRMQTAAAIGGVPVNIVPPLAYQNLQTGVIEGQLMSGNMAGDFKIYEVAKYAVMYNFGQVAFPVLMNKDTWNKISLEDQKIMLDVIKPMLVEFHELSAKVNNEKVALSKEKGQIQVIPTQAEKAQWDAAVNTVAETWIKDAKAAGVANAEEILNYYRKAMAEAKK
jgi:TRAP-type C4-dicarboxylate transport system substrate-binding protein